MSKTSFSLPSFSSTNYTNSASSSDNNDQGVNNNEPDTSIYKIPTLYLGYLSNSIAPDSESKENVVINLNPMCVNWCDFITLFFQAPGGAFTINPSNSTSQFLTINSQTYTNTINEFVNFSLTDQIQKAWSKKNNKPVSSISPNLLILLNRTVFLTKSLANIRCYSTGLSIDEAISSLTDSCDIEPGNIYTEATVRFIISYRDYFKPLDVSLMINFIYITKIPCYKNKIDCFINCTPYSNDCNNCRDHLDSESATCSSNPDLDSGTDFTFNKKSVFEQDDLATVSSNPISNHSVGAETENCSIAHNELDNIINYCESTGDNTESSSNWAI